MLHKRVPSSPQVNMVDATVDQLNGIEISPDGAFKPTGPKRPRGKRRLGRRNANNAVGGGEGVLEPDLDTIFEVVSGESPLPRYCLQPHRRAEGRHRLQCAVGCTPATSRPRQRPSVAPLSQYPPQSILGPGVRSFFLSALRVVKPHLLALVCCVATAPHVAQ